jgi:ABC-2 type transport system permease protein
MIRHLFALIRRSFGRSRGLLVSFAAVLASFQVLVAIAGSYLQQQQAFSQIVAMLPPIAQQFFGAFLSSFTGMVAFGYWHPVVIIAFVGVAIVVASEPAADVESGLVDLLLARPLPRARLITRSILMTAVTTVVLAALMMAASAASLAVIGGTRTVAPTMRIVGRLAVNLVAVSWCLGALSLGASTVLPRRGAAAGAAGIAAFALYLLNALADVSSPFKRYGPCSPFHYYQPMAIVSGDPRWKSDVALLVAAAALLVLLAYTAWSRRDL